MSEELKPCPFCGGKAERIDIEDGENAGGCCIACTACGASGAVEFEFKENFVSNWNRRSPDWQRVERAPRGKAVLVFKENTQEQYVAALIDGGHGPGWCTQDGFELFKVTRWQDLPANPPTIDEHHS